MSDDFPQLYNNSQQFLNPFSARAFRSDHPGGVQFVRVDGSVMFLANGSSPELRRALVTRRGHDTVTEDR